MDEKKTWIVVSNVTKGLLMKSRVTGRFFYGPVLDLSAEVVEFDSEESAAIKAREMNGTVMSAD